MLVDTNKESLCINQIVEEKEKIVNIEGDIIIPDVKPDILSPVNTSGNVCIYKKEILDGKIRIDGSININLIYLPESQDETNGVRGLTTSLDFTEIIDLEKARVGMNSKEIIQIQDIECKVLNGRKISLKVCLKIRTVVYSNENISIIKEINNMEHLQKLSNSTKINSLIGQGSTKIYAKDTINIDNVDNLVEILKTDVQIINKDIKISYNKVLAKADLEVKILYLTEDDRIGRANGIIPVMGFIDIPNISDENICDLNYYMKNLVVKSNSIEEHSVYVEAQIGIECFVYETKEVDVIEDLYSPCENIVLTKKNIRAMMEKEKLKDVCTINEQVQIPEMANNRLYDVEIMPRITTQTELGNQILYEGEIGLNFIYEGDSKLTLNTRKENIKFSFKTSINETKMSRNIQTEIEIKDSNFIVQNGNIECKLQLEFNIDIANNANIDIIDTINIEEDNNQKNYSMVIYFVKKGDTLWKIAKKFRSTVNDIVNANNIEDPNVIMEGMQLFIPKYINKKSD